MQESLTLCGLTNYWGRLFGIKNYGWGKPRALFISQEYRKASVINADERVSGP
jgi:hypothetical protein